jgi:integrase
VGQWEEDSWTLLGTTDKGEQVERVLHFPLTNPDLKIEIKYACWYYLTQGRGSGQKSNTQRKRLNGFQHLVTWLNQVTPPIRSLLERDLAFWICSLRTWLVQTGQYHPTSAKGLKSTQTYQEYKREDRHIGLLKAVYFTLTEAYDPRQKMERDIWDLRTFGIKLNLSRAGHLLNFTSIAQPWLRELSKRYLGYNLTIFGAADTQRKLSSINIFSRFLAQEAPQAQIADINQELMLRYLVFLQTQELAVSTRYKTLVTLRIFLETCAHRLHAPGLTREPLIFDEDLPRVPESDTREIPEEVLAQLRVNLKALPTTLLRMVTILLEVGLRINELCQLPIDCLICDDKHEWYLRFYQSKVHREHVIPLVEEEVIGTIQAQQQDIRARWGKDCPYLFPAMASHTKPFLQVTFTKKLNEWAVRCQITDQKEQLYRFTAHQFRHSLGMRLINDDVPLEVISRLLGHHSLQMSQVYARVRDKKVRADLERVARKRKTVDYQGNAVKGDPQANDPEVQMTRKGVRGQTLAVGGCARLIVLGDCNHANKCLTCPMWLTSTDDLPALKSFYDRAIRLKQRAIEKGNQIVIEQQDRIIPTIALRIKSLEATEMDGSLCVDDILTQLRTDLAEAECGLEEAQSAGLVLAARHLERAIAEMKMRIAALEVPDDSTNG